MSVIAWDGRTLAADKQSTSAGMRVTTTKLRELEDGTVLAWCGDQDSGEAVAAWFVDGKDTAKWPECQRDKDLWARLIVCRADGVETYERQPYAIRVEDSFMAWGSGRDYAMGALACGKSAKESVEIACRFDNGCGMGIDVVTFDKQARAGRVAS